ncbi:MAG: TetR family transcriptional regulator [Gammaproteobacteria bacterium]|nr:MAG: TetR family transcriptional regulator [Gammaproteobacteria bacterium]
MNAPDPDLRERILDEALALAALDSWEAVRLHAVADRLGIGLDTIRGHFAEKEDLVEAFFDRADAAMLRCSEQQDLLHLDPRARLQTLILAWLHALAPHRRVVREMIAGKLEPGHLHVQIPGLLRVSRTVQWLREAAGLDATFLRRALEETALTGIYLATFARWLNDDLDDFAATVRFLEGALGGAERLAEGFGGWGRSEAASTHGPKDS